MTIMFTMLKRLGLVAVSLFVVWCVMSIETSADHGVMIPPAALFGFVAALALVLAGQHSRPSKELAHGWPTIGVHLLLAQFMLVCMADSLLWQPSLILVLFAASALYWTAVDLLAISRLMKRPREGIASTPISIPRTRA